MVGVQVETPILGNGALNPPASTEVRRTKSDRGPFEASNSKSALIHRETLGDGKDASLNQQKGDATSYLKVLEPQLLKRTASVGLGWLQVLWKGRPIEEPKGPTLTSKYEIVKRRIGSGTTSQIQLVRKIGEGDKGVLAVKLFYKKWRDSGDVESRVGEEFCLASALNHRNVIRVHELIQDDLGHWCQVMDYCPGGDLRTVIQDGFLSRPEIDCCFRQLIQGVAYMHSMGVAHRDIKPENILIADNCILKITDFGCSDAFYDSVHVPCNKTFGFMGSEPYMSPEIIQSWQPNSASIYDPRLADIWACGIVYLVMSSSSIPFKIAHESRDKGYAQYLATRATQEVYPLFKPLRGECQELLVKILDPVTETRATMNDILSDPWFSAIEVCHEGQAASSFHLHFALDYSPVKST